MPTVLLHAPQVNASVMRLQLLTQRMAQSCTLEERQGAYLTALQYI